MENKVFELLAEKKYTRLRSLLAEMNPADIAQILNESPSKEQLPVIYRILPKELASEVFAYLDSDMQQLIIETFSDAELREVLDELFLDDTVDIIDEMPA
ncbi:MAG: magnesium transporter, partial [Acutalibacteraceae bacterium]|nr:magnesium transporter [Acutalibacteraceae bacterium]